MSRRKMIELIDGRVVPVVVDPARLSHDERLALLRVNEYLGPIALDPRYAPAKGAANLDQGRLS